MIQIYELKLIKENNANFIDKYNKQSHIYDSLNENIETYNILDKMAHYKNRPQI